MFDALKDLDWPNVLWALLTIATAVVALTPTQYDDGVVSRIKNVLERYLPKG
jgi:hypothetical protein